MEDRRKYLQPAVVAQLATMELRARMVVEGFVTGLHKSPYHGFSVEFAEHRQYQPGDDLRYLDWKIVGRTNRYYVKQFEEETNVRTMILMDVSASMRYASQGNVSKYDYACWLASALALLMIKQQDAVGLALYDHELRTYLPPRSKPSYIQEVFRALGSASPSDISGAAAPIGIAAERLGRRGLAIVLSDFFDDTQSIAQALKHLRHRRHDVIVMQILDPRELDLQLGTGATFRDMETGEEIVTQPHQLAKAYSAVVAKHNQSIRQECFNRNIDYVLVRTDQPFDIALREYLARRRKL